VSIEVRRAVASDAKDLISLNREFDPEGRIETSAERVATQIESREPLNKSTASLRDLKRAGARRSAQAMAVAAGVIRPREVVNLVNEATAFYPD